MNKSTDLDDCNDNALLINRANKIIEIEVNWYCEFKSIKLDASITDKK